MAAQFFPGSFGQKSATAATMGFDIVINGGKQVCRQGGIETFGAGSQAGRVNIKQHPQAVIGKFRPRT